ncbi:hypothetical protein SISSUDRAFT_653955 [Sistotremastrum suecicum HHB10207 ss-3]|uniref:Uncharacterized protein n=1 Tax=Sistotremastrum suecicum HHB10207 ss-3 TaxID=1314776 RepID=A0A166E962_9AGAM|nr:hypothetical protein SISSUDRAFT_653955 [Sistotremastrum suecicum HHB10207 ss-3]
MFLPKGGLLGFGLKHEYPVSSSSELQTFLSYLKGIDAAIVTTAKSLGLKAYLRAIYDLNDCVDGDWDEDDEDEEDSEDYEEDYDPNEGYEDDDSDEDYEDYYQDKGKAKSKPEKSNWTMTSTVVDLQFYGQLELKSEIIKLIRYSRDGQGFTPRGFIKYEDEENPKTELEREQVIVTTRWEICDIGTKRVKQAVERKTVTNNLQTKKKTSVTQVIDAIDQEVKDAKAPPSKADEDSEVVINWITQVNTRNPVETAYISYGNEASMSHIYARVNLIVEVPKREERQLQRSGNVV